MDYLELFLARLDAVGAAVALIAAFFSAVGATLSAQYAKQVAERAAEDAQLGAWRDARRMAASTHLAFPAIRDTLTEAEQRWRSASNKHGTVGGDRVKLRLNAIAGKRQETDSLEERLAALDLGLDSMQRLKPAAAAQLHAELDAIHLQADALNRWAFNDAMDADAETRR